MKNHHAVLYYVADIGSFAHPETSDQETVEIFRRDTFTITNARALIERANRKPDNDAILQQLIILFETITVEAQQALLKIVEEPPETTKFIFVVPIGTTLLPTLLSRFSVATTPRSEEIPEQFTNFLEASIRTRLEMIDESIKQKKVAWQHAIKQGLIIYLAKEKGAYSRHQLSVLEFVARTLLTRGASNKFLLEELALTL